MKNVKRVVSLLLILVMSLGIFVGCKKEEAYNGARKLTVGIPQDTTIPDYNENGLTKYLEEQTGIEIEFVFFANAAANYKQQFTLMCTGNEKLPDVMVGFRGLGHYTVNQFGEDGYIIDLRDLIEEHAPNYQKQLSEQTEDIQKYIKEKGTNTNDGSFYAMPLGGAVEAMDNMQSAVYINQTWLTKLGLQKPTNVSELVNVCRAFATQDPNGNGEADEMPMLGEIGLAYWLLNAFVEYDANNFNVKDGKVWDPVVTDEFRQGLDFVNSMVEEGLLNELSFTLSRNEVRNLISPLDGTEGVVGIFSGHHETRTNAMSDALNDYVALGTLADETGKGGYNIINELYNYIYWSGFITSDCKNPELAMEFLDAFYTDECVTRQRHGVKDVDWYYEEGKNSYGTDSYARVINGQAYFDGSLNATLGCLLGIQNQWNFLLVDEVGEGRAAQAARLQREQWDVRQNSGKRQEGQLAGLVYTQEEYEQRELKAGGITSFISEQVILFMYGEKDPMDDKTWGEFKATLKTLGRNELMKIAQSAYDRKVGK